MAPAVTYSEPEIGCSIKSTSQTFKALLGGELALLLVLALTGNAHAQTCTPPSNGLIGHWPGNGNANDIAGSNNGTLINGATFAAGKVGQAFSFDGINDFVQTNNNIGITGNSPRTVCAWIKATSTQSAGGRPCCPTPFSWGVDLSSQCFGNFMSSGEWFAWGCVDDIRTLVIDNLDWNHHCVTYNSSAATYYINGVPVATQNKGWHTGNSPLIIGDGFNHRRPPSPIPTPFNGRVDEFLVYNRALKMPQKFWTSAILAAAASWTTSSATRPSLPRGVFAQGTRHRTRVALVRSRRTVVGTRKPPASVCRTSSPRDSRSLWSISLRTRFSTSRSQRVCATRRRRPSGQ